MKKILLGIFFYLLFNGLVFARHDAVWLKASNEINKTLPSQHTQDLILDNTFYVDSTFVNNFSSIYKKSEINPIILKNYKTSAKKIITNNVCSTPLYKKMLIDGVTVKYIIYGKEGLLLTIIILSISDCS